MAKKLSPAQQRAVIEMWWAGEIKRQQEAQAAPAVEAEPEVIDLKAAYEEEVKGFAAGKYPDAEHFFRRKIAESSDRYAHRYGLGTILLVQGKTAEARDVFFTLSDDLVAEGLLQEAKQPLREVAMINDAQYYAAAHLRLGAISEKLGHYLDAVMAYEQAAGYEAGDEAGWYGLFRAYQGLGQTEAAEKYRRIADRVSDEREMEMGRFAPTKEN